eukprot:CAMPEP_0177634502 /NCGR_PEP_ID=MMETSP0447-20121125/3401_1 /TAXON_ID=0 /ORGANISM="Stygamoeba regulata, Strain BSH-02190019" /LENGTH=123 /DNA_ID=CAMNT_0019136225 /DNA_START=1 /DNA_END=369 /DNA_ORIENTATION=-
MCRYADNRYKLRKLHVSREYGGWKAWLGRQLASSEAGEGSCFREPVFADAWDSPNCRSDGRSPDWGMGPNSSAGQWREGAREPAHMRSSSDLDKGNRGGVGGSIFLVVIIHARRQRIVIHLHL